MISTCSISKLRDMPADETYLIVRSLKRPIAGTKQLDVLSPSPELFWSYLRWRDAGAWNAQTFHEQYEPTFRAQIASDETAQEWLNYLTQMSHETDIVLACFCADVSLCHRSIVADILRERGAAVGDVK